MESATTELTRLPGLEAPRPSAEPQPEHWIERGPSKRLMVFSGRSHPELAQRIARAARRRASATSSSRRSRTTRRTAATRSRSAAPTSSSSRRAAPPVDQHLMELLLMIQAAKLASAKRITAVIPLVPVLAAGPKAQPREPISARLVADMLQLAGADRVLTMDLHAGQIQGFFDVPVDHMTALPLFAQHFRDLGLAGEERRLRRARRRPRASTRAVRGDDRRRPRDHAQDAAGPRTGRDVTEVTATSTARCAIIGDDMIDDRRHADRRREVAERARREGGLRRSRPTGSSRRRALERIADSPTRQRSSSPTPCRSIRSRSRTT